MKKLAAAVLAMSLATGPVTAQQLIDKGFIHGWNLMVDPSFGNGCLIQTVYQDLSVVRLGYDAKNNRGYFAVFNKAWGQIEQGKQYNIRFDLDGQSFDGVAIGMKPSKVPGAVVFFTDRNFVHAIAQKQGMIVYGQTGQQVMAIDLTGSAKALDYVRQCQDEMGWGG